MDSYLVVGCKLVYEEYKYINFKLLQKFLEKKTLNSVVKYRKYAKLSHLIRSQTFFYRLFVFAVIRL